MKPSSGLSRRQFVFNLTRAAGTGWVVAARLESDSVAAQTSSTPGWQIGCYTRPFDKFDWRTAYDAIAEVGFKYVGLISTNTKDWIMIRVNTPLEEAQRMGDEAKQRGLKMLSVYGDFSVVKSLQEGVDGLRHLIDSCAVAGSPNLLLGGVSDAKLAEPYFKAIQECCDYAQAKGVALSIKPHGGQNATGPQCRKAIENVGRKNFGLWYDPGNIFYYSEGALDPVEDASTVGDLVVGMSVKDYRHPKDVMVTPGTGRVNFREVFVRLKKGGFTRGPLLVECLAQGELSFLKNQARQARQFLEELLAS